jgi:hypothetical protein
VLLVIFAETPYKYDPSQPKASASDLFPRTQSNAGNSAANYGISRILPSTAKPKYLSLPSKQSRNNMRAEFRNTTGI